MEPKGVVIIREERHENGSGSDGERATVCSLRRTVVEGDGARGSETAAERLLHRTGDAARTQERGHAGGGWRRRVMRGRNINRCCPLWVRHRGVTKMCWRRCARWCCRL